MPLVTIKDIAREAGVGMTSVSRALNGQPGLSEATRARILAVAEELQFTPNPHARNLKVKTNRKVVIAVVKGPTNPMFQVLVDQLAEALRERGFMLETARASNAEDEYEVARTVMRNDKPAGLVLLGGVIDPLPADLERLRVPFVLCTTPELDGIEPATYSSVRVDEQQSVRLQVEALIDRGHRRIAYIGMPPGEHSSGAVRLRAFIDVMTEHGLDCGPDLQLFAEADQDSYYTFGYGHALTSELIDGGTDVTAICAASDTIALGAHKAILERGLRIPEDFSVVGFDGIEQSSWVHPELATVRQPLDRFVEATCDVLLGQIEDGRPRQHVVLPGELLVRDSLGSR